MKKNNMIKKAFNNIYISSELEEKIFDKTVNRSNKKHLKKIYIGLSMFVGILCFGTFCVYGDELREIIESWSSKVEFENGENIVITEASFFKKIPDEMSKYDDGEGRVLMTNNEIEEVLGFDILMSDRATSDMLGYSPLVNPKGAVNEGKIGRIDLWYAGFIKEEQKKTISMSVSFLTQYAWNGQIEAFEEGIDATGGKELDNIYYFENLDVNVVIYGSDWDDTRLTAVFVYNDCLYQLIANNYTVEELCLVIESLDK